MGQDEAGIGLNPFRPGAGRPPPYLAGRAEEQRQLAAEVADMQAAGVGNTVIMHGPLGMGRLALDGAMQEDAQGPWWLRKVEGWVPRDLANPNNGTQDKVLVVWRKLTGGIEQDNLLNLREQGESWAVRLTEEEFMRRMWEETE